MVVGDTVQLMKGGAAFVQEVGGVRINGKGMTSEQLVKGLQSRACHSCCMFPLELGDIIMIP